MKDNKHIKSFNEHQENLNITDVMNSLFEDSFFGVDIEKLVSETIGFNEHDREVRVKILDFVNKYKLEEKERLNKTISLLQKYYS